MRLDPDIIAAHNEYMRLLREYQESKEAYEIDDSDMNYEKLRQAAAKLKAHSDRMEIERRIAGL